MAKKRDDEEQSYFIETGNYRPLLLEAGVPYTATKCDRFDLRDYVREVEHEEDDGRKTKVRKREQQEFWKACLQFGLEDPKGWVACFSGEKDIMKVDALAATVMGAMLREGKYCKWINITAARWGEYTIKEITKSIAGPPALLVLSGLRWDSDHVRFDKVFDLMREVPESCNKIIVGVGENPVAITRALGIIATRVVHLRSYAETDI